MEDVELDEEEPINSNTTLQQTQSPTSPARAGASPDKPYYYQLSRCINCSKAIHKLESVVASTSTSSSDSGNDAGESSDGIDPVNQVGVDVNLSAQTFTELTRHIKQQMQSIATEPFLISTLHYTACIEAMRYIFKLSQDEVDYLLGLNAGNEVTLCRACGDLIKNTYNGLRSLEKLRDKDTEFHARLCQKNQQQYHNLEYGVPGDTTSSLALPVVRTGDGPLEVVVHVVQDPVPKPECEDKGTMTEQSEDLEQYEDLLDKVSSVHPVTTSDSPKSPPRIPPPSAPVVAHEDNQDEEIISVIEEVEVEVESSPSGRPVPRLRRYSDGDIYSLKSEPARPQPTQLLHDKAIGTEALSTAVTEHICWSCGEPITVSTTQAFSDDRGTMTESMLLTPVQNQETMTESRILTPVQDQETMIQPQIEDKSTMTAVTEMIDKGIDTTDMPWNKPPEPKKARITKSTLLKLPNGLKASVTASSSMSNCEESELKIMNSFTITDGTQPESASNIELQLTGASPAPSPAVEEQQNRKRARLHIKQSAPMAPKKARNEHSESAGCVNVNALPILKKIKTEPIEESATSLQREPGQHKSDSDIRSPLPRLLLSLIKRMSVEMGAINIQLLSLRSQSCASDQLQLSHALSILESMITAARNIYLNLDETAITFKEFLSTPNLKEKVSEFEKPIGTTIQSVPVDVLAGYFNLLLKIEPFLDTSTNCRFWVALSTYKQRLIRIIKCFLDSSCAANANMNQNLADGLQPNVTGLYESYFMNICNGIKISNGSEEQIEQRVNCDIPWYGAGIWTQIQACNRSIDVTAANMDHKILGIWGFNQQIAKVLSVLQHRSRLQSK